MDISPPKKQDLLNAASKNYLDLTEEELEGFSILLQGIFSQLEALDQLFSAIPAPVTGPRDFGQRPGPGEDPYNAILRRCMVKGSGSGKLSGVRVGLKDNISVSGMPMTCGSHFLSGYIPDTDATVVQRILDEGGNIVAMLNMDDFAWSGSGETSVFGPVCNPHNTEYLAGGSSAGSGAALFYNDIDVTLGCDQGGSIRIPAAWCGVVGLKPTFGLVPYTGIVSGETTFDHVGPMARSVDKVALMLEVIAGKDPLDQRQGHVPRQDFTDFLGQDVTGVRIGIVKEGFGTDDSEEEVDEAVRRALAGVASLGIETTDVSIPYHLSSLAIYRGVIPEGATALLQTSGLGYNHLGYYDSGLGTAIREGLESRANSLPPDVKLTLLLGSYLRERYGGWAYAKSQNLRPALRKAYDDMLSEVDLIAMPTVPTLPFKYDPDQDWVTRIDRGAVVSKNCAPFNASGHPAISLPCAKVKGLPVGLMLVAKHFEDGLLIKVADALQRGMGWD